MAKEVVSQVIQHPVLGEISIKRLSTARNISARWKNADLLKVTIPPGLTAKKVNRALEDMMPALLKRRPQKQYFVEGWTYITPEITFEVHAGSRPGYYCTRTLHDVQKVTFYSDCKSSPEGCEAFNDYVNNGLKKYSRLYAPVYLLPLAQELAAKIGVSPRSINVSHGLRVLGRCTSKGDVFLSKNLIFYPTHLREYVILHEFAHLTHMNHGAGFHQLLEKYLGQSRRPLEKALRNHQLPFK